MAATSNTYSIGNSSTQASDDSTLQLLVADDLKNISAEYEEFCQHLQERISQQELQISSKRIDKGTLHQAIVDFHSSVQHQVSAKDQFDRHGLGKFTTRLSIFATWTLDFFDTYSGMAEIVRGIDNNFGPIAYGVFSLFLTVARSKEMQRGLIQSILDQLGIWLPRAEIITARDLSHPKLMRFVLDIYIETVRFFRYATEFLCSSRASRAWKLVSRPPQHDLQKRLDKIKDKNKNLLEELIFRLYERNAEMASQLNFVANTVGESADSARKNAGDGHRNQLRSLAKALDLPPEIDDHIASMITHCDSQRYQDFFEFQRKAAFRPVRLRQISLQDLSRRSPYMNWMSATKSSLLLLGGENKDINIPQSWLSPVAPKFFNCMQQSPNCVVVFYSINAAWAYRSHQSPEYEILLALKNILYQVLSIEIRLCQSFYEDFIQAGSLPIADSTSEDEIDMLIHDWTEMLSAALSSSHLETQTIFIVLDGVERLSAPAPQTLFDNLLQLLDNCDKHRTIKILSICSALGLGKIKGSKDEKGLRYALGQGGNTEMMNRVFADLCWNQPVLEERL